MLVVPGLLSVLYWPAAFYLTYRGLHLATDFWIGRTESRWLVITGVIVLGLILGGSMLAGAILLHRAFIMTVCAPHLGARLRTCRACPPRHNRPTAIHPPDGP